MAADRPATPGPRRRRRPSSPAGRAGGGGSAGAPSGPPPASSASSATASSPRTSPTATGEIDLLALDGETLVVVEVRSTRRSADPASDGRVGGPPQAAEAHRGGAAVPGRAGGCWARSRSGSTCWPSAGRPTPANPPIRHIPHAFEAAGRFQFFIRRAISRMSSCFDDPCLRVIRSDSECDAIPPSRATRPHPPRRRADRAAGRTSQEARAQPRDRQAAARQVRHRPDRLRRPPRPHGRRCGSCGSSRNSATRPCSSSAPPRPRSATRRPRRDPQGPDPRADREERRRLPDADRQGHRRRRRPRCGRNGEWFGRFGFARRCCGCSARSPCSGCWSATTSPSGSRPARRSTCTSACTR